MIESGEVFLTAKARSTQKLAKLDIYFHRFAQPLLLLSLGHFEKYGLRLQYL